ncbi:wHTH domain-containing protein [Streptomyces diastatochromogenes]|uniref:wHTH domain-containing protein n=1 Tax=Streptomyces diastatochromogenes TaxID=42236 RepID=UPI00367E61AE
MTEPLGYWKALAKLLELAERPKATALHAAMVRNAPQHVRVPGDSTVADWIAMRRIPRDDGQLKLFLSTLQYLALERTRHPAPRFPTEDHWRRMAETARAEQGARAKENGPPAPTQISAHRADWQKDVADSAAWQLVKSDDRERSDSLRSQVLQFTDVLEELHEETRPFLADDPWRDARLAQRISRRTSQVLHLLRRDNAGFLAPAEAALTALLPFLYQVHRARTAAELSRVGPTDLAQRTSPDEERRLYEVMLSGHERLVRRAGLGGLEDRRDESTEIGWWLFHQWAKRQPGRLADLLSAAHDQDSGLDDLAVVLDPDLLPRLLSCAHAGPLELFDSARAEHLREDPFQLDFHGRDFQDVRERLIGPLFAVAHAMAIEVADLSSVIVRHVGIPEALDSGRLLTTLDKASWQSRRDGIGLKASCDHPAVVAALTEHVQRFESLLRVVRHSGAPELSGLPLHTRADEVREVDDSGAPVPVDGLIRFRLDEERVQELLMGENLYRDRSLAIRELYQNALDACRYRRARSEAADSLSSYEGRIEFTQGFDEEEGRHYLQCRDNGVGMDELTLSEVFSQAGVRFTDLPRYLDERQEWQSRGVTMHPNSRFGIGVLSYFMLADEVRVTTCHMDRQDGKLRELTVLITGPGHYFRVRPTGRPGTIGTTVRLYLREGDKAPSCVRELRRFLGIAEFTTTAAHGAQTVPWEAGVMRPREALGVRPNGFEAHGRAVPWSAGPHGSDGQVIWCEHGGGILVDGIYAEPRVRRGILSDPSDLRRLRGAVVNLTGATRPRRLSVDRTEILDDDVCADVERLITGALPALLSAEPALLSRQWLTEVAAGSPRLADVVTEAAGAAGYELEVGGTSSSMAVAGFFPPDRYVVPGLDIFESNFRGEHGYGEVDDATRLWRLLAHPPRRMLTALAHLVPQLDKVESVLPAIPSDALSRTTAHGEWNNRAWPSTRELDRLSDPGHAFLVASACGVSYRDVVARMADLCLPTPPPPHGDTAVDEVNSALLSGDLLGLGRPLQHERQPRQIRTDKVVSPGHLLKAHVEFGISVSEAAARLKAFGVTVPDLLPLADDADELVLRLLSTGLGGSAPWLGVERPVPPGHLLRARTTLGIDIEAAARWMRAFGFTVPDTSAMAEAPDETTFHLVSHGPGELLNPADPVSVGHVLRTAFKLGRPVAVVARELRALGFRTEIGPGHERLTEDLLAESAAWGWSLDDWALLRDGEPVPPGMLVRAASGRGVSLLETARHIGSLGFAVPTMLPESAEEEDEIILSTNPGLNPMNDDGWLPAGRSVGVLHVVDAALSSGLSPAAVASRLRLYGLEPEGTSFPHTAEPVDTVLLDWGWRALERVSPDRPVPARHVLGVAADSGTSVRAVIDRLAEYGLSTQLTAAADEFDPQLLRVYAETYSTDSDQSIPLYQAVHRAHRVSVEWRDAVKHAPALGFRILGDHTSPLDGLDHRLCLLDKQSNILLLDLAEPLPDFLNIMRAAQLPVPELVRRLERLGVDLPRVRDAVLAALPRVPGLVMKPEAEAPPAQ